MRRSAAQLVAFALIALASGVSAAEEAREVWTCSMHPQVRLSGPGKCPICEMPLIRAASAEKETSAGAEPLLKLSDHALKMASVETAQADR